MNYFDYQYLTNFYKKQERSKRNNLTLSQRVDRFNQLCGNWDYRNIDMTQPHLSSISIDIDRYKVNVYCEKYDVDLEEYISCKATTLLKGQADYIIQNFKVIFSEEWINPKDLINYINYKIDWDYVREELETIKEEYILGMEHPQNKRKGRSL